MTRISKGFIALSWAVFAVMPGFNPASAQGIGNSGTITGTVTDPSGAVIKGATVEIQNKVTGYDKTATTDGAGSFKILGVPHNSYHTVVAATGFQSHIEDVDVRTSVPVNLAIALVLGESTTSVDVL